MRIAVWYGAQKEHFTPKRRIKAPIERGKERLRLSLYVIVPIASGELHGDERTNVLYLFVVFTGVIGGCIKQYFADALALIFGRNHGVHDGEVVGIYPIVGEIAQFFFAFKGHELAVLLVIGVIDCHCCCLLYVCWRSEGVPWMLLAGWIWYTRALYI